jgi:hypothetical protein
MEDYATWQGGKWRSTEERNVHNTPIAAMIRNTPPFDRQVMTRR